MEHSMQHKCKIMTKEEGVVSPNKSAQNLVLPKSPTLSDIEDLLSDSDSKLKQQLKPKVEDLGQTPSRLASESRSHSQPFTASQGSKGSSKIFTYAEIEKELKERSIA